MPRWMVSALLVPMVTAMSSVVFAQQNAHPDRHAGHVAESTATASEAGDPHAGHAAQHPPDSVEDAHHAGHQGQASSPAPLPTPTAEDIAVAFPDMHGMRMQDHMDDDPVLATLRFERLEWQDAGIASNLGWELQSWVGDLQNRVWLRSEGERRHGGTEHGNVELLWGRPTGPWWDALLGVRHDLGQGPSRDWLAFGVQGMAPYKFEVSATGYVGREGRLAATLEAEYELLLTNRLILQPRGELNAYSKQDTARGIGKGISDASLGLRLRYEIHRQFAPYVGYEWSRSFGDTADLARSAGELPNQEMWVAGLRFWF